MKKIFVYILIISLIGSSCGKSFITNLQNNPNSPTNSAATPPLVLPGTLTGLANILNGAGVSGGYQFQAAWFGYWNYSGGYSFNQTAQEYVVTNSSPQVWDNYYGDLANLNVIMQFAATNKTYQNYGAIADVIAVICYQNLVDAYNDIPYSQSLKGVGNFFPSYDKGSNIYDSLTVRLDNAIAELQSPPASAAVPGGEDIMFRGNLSLWAKFANTVKLRLLLRESAVSAKQAMITSEIAKTASVGYLTTNAMVNPGYNAAQQGPLYGAFGVSTGGGLNGSYNYIRAGGYALNFYITTSDPRLGYFYSGKGQDPTNGNMSTYGDYYAALNATPTNTSDYYGDMLGIQVTQPAKGSGIGPGINFSAGQSAVIMTAAESYFVQAEARVRGYITSGPSAQALYQAGITASFEFLGVGGSTGDPDAAATAYYSQPNVANVSWPAATIDQIQAIITQKWAALNGINNAEAWNDWRRTGFPVVPISKSPTLPATSHIPYRYYYPAEEPTTNAAAWSAAGGDKVDPFNSKIFWMP
jgi:SusD/RagB-like outer membrane lipoprotein